MRLLLDSHVIIWAAFGGSNLSPTAYSSIADPLNEKFVSPISVYELEVKRLSGRFPFPAPPDWEAAFATAGFSVLPISILATARAAALPAHHGDPWDRLLIAQALVAGLTVVTKDRVFPSYGVATLW